MKVHLIKKATIDEFIVKYGRGKSSFSSWYAIVKGADWSCPEDIVRTFNTSDILGKGSNRVVFNIAGNNYRMICAYFFGKEKVHLFVKWIGTHAEYSKLCAKNLQYEIDIY